MPTTLSLLDEAARLVHELETPEEQTGDLDPRIDAWIEAAEDKIGACAVVRRRLAQEVAGLAEEERRIQSRRRALERQQEGVEARATALLGALAAVGEEPKARGAWGSAWTVTTQSVRVNAVGALPSTWTRVRTEPDTARIREALLAGIEVPGAELVATVGARFR